jgi:hypothetical protein
VRFSAYFLVLAWVVSTEYPVYRRVATHPNA